MILTKIIKNNKNSYKNFLSSQKCITFSRFKNIFDFNYSYTNAESNMLITKFEGRVLKSLKRPI